MPKYEVTWQETNVMQYSVVAENPEAAKDPSLFLTALRGSGFTEKKGPLEILVREMDDLGEIIVVPYA